MNAPKNVYMSPAGVFYKGDKQQESDIEYVPVDAFIEKARKWFEKQPEQYDANGVRCYSIEDFEDFLKAMKL